MSASPSRRYEVRSEGGIGTLSIFGVRTLDVGEFSCQVVSAQYGTQLALRSIAVNVTDGNYIARCIALALYAYIYSMHLMFWPKS